MHKKNAFTILEVVAVMGLLVASSFFLLPFLITQVKDTDTEFFTSQLTSSIFLIQQNAFSQKQGDATGIKVEQDKYYLFSGPNFVGGNVIGEVSIPRNLDITNINFFGGVSEVTFSQGSVIPSASGSFDISDGIQDYRISINSEGLIEYFKL